MQRREFVGSAIASGVVRGATATARCRLLNARGEPVPPDMLDGFHVCDSLLRVTPIAPRYAPGEVRFTPPEKPFRIAVILKVPGFGQVYVYADNGGRGYTPKDFAGAEPLPLNREFAASRLATVRRYLELCQGEGVGVSSGARSRVESAAGLLEKREFMESLRDSLWAGEMLVFERAQHAISKRGTRPGFLFGANGFQARKGNGYTSRFEALFNYATVPFYRGEVERVRGKRDYEWPKGVLEWLGTTKIVPKGHPLVWFLESSTPAWMKTPPMPYDEAKQSATAYARETVQKFRDRIHKWDVINEAANQNALHFTADQMIDLTAAAARAAREGDPQCFRVINSCCTWNDFMRRQKRPGSQTVYDYLAKVKDAGVDFEAVGLQYYYDERDMLEVERSIENFKNFGKPVHITELGTASSSERVQDKQKSPIGPGPAWHGETWTETAQADWIEQFYTMAYSKPYIEAITWWDLADPAFVTHAGLLHEDLTPKQGYHRLAGLLKKWRQG